MYENILNLFKEIGAKISESVVQAYDTDEGRKIVGNGAGGDKTKKIDKIAEDIVISEISKNFHNFCIISEEAGIKFFGDKIDKFFFVDPIDGSNNATRGIPLFSTSLAFSTSQNINDIKIGYVKNIFGEEFYAIKGKGAYKENKNMKRKILMDNKEEIEFLGVEFAPYGKNIDKISNIIKIAKHYRTIGCVTLGLCYVADNALDAYVDLRPPRILDITGSKIIIEESGGVFYLDKENLIVDTKIRANLIAGNEKNVEKIKEILKI